MKFQILKKGGNQEMKMRKLKEGIGRGFYDNSYPERRVYAAGTKIGMLKKAKMIVWFVIPLRGPTTVDWVFTATKQQMPRKQAAEIYNNLLALGFERVV
jgi:hypothetical protein